MKRLKRARLWAGMTLEQAGAAVGKYATWVSRRESGEVQCSVHELRMLAELYGLDERQVLEIILDPDAAVQP